VVTPVAPLADEPAVMRYACLSCGNIGPEPVPFGFMAFADRGAQSIDKGLRAWLASLGDSPVQFDVDQVRAQGRARALARAREPEVASVRDGSIGAESWTIKVRVYEPADAAGTVIVYLHGGMWMVGDLETHDRTCRRLAVATDARVVAVDYRRAPEHRWPTAVEDGLGAVEWAAAALDSPKPLIAGDSAGGHLALLVALRLRDMGDDCGGLLLACPNVDLRFRTRSVHELGHGWGLDVESLRWAVEQWIPHGVSMDDPAVNPLLADLAGLPPVVIVTADHDPLRDEGHALAHGLRQAGVSVVERCEPGMVHGFVQNLDQVSPRAGEAIDRWHADARRLLANISGRQ
jgi:acetyl esterase